MPTPWNCAYALARLAHRQDREAWAYVAQTCSKGIYTLSWRILRDHALAEDAQQETLLQVRRHAGRFRSPESSPDAAARSWILHIAYNVSLKMARKRARLRPPSSCPLPPSADHAYGETASSVQCAVLRLPETYRSPIVLRYYGGLPYEEVAERLGLQPAAVRKRVERGLGLLRERMAAEKEMNNAVVAGCLLALPAGFASPEPILPAASSAPALMGVIPFRFGVRGLGTWAGLAAAAAVVLCVVGLSKDRGEAPDATFAAARPAAPKKAVAKAEPAPAPQPAPLAQALPASKPQPIAPPQTAAPVAPPPAAPKPAANEVPTPAPAKDPEGNLEVEIAPRVIYRKNGDDLDVTAAAAKPETPAPEPWKQDGPRIQPGHGRMPLIPQIDRMQLMLRQEAGKGGAHFVVNGKEVTAEEFKKARRVLDVQLPAGNQGNVPLGTITINLNGEAHTIHLNGQCDAGAKQGP